MKYYTKQQARRLVRYALATGILTRAVCCKACGIKQRLRKDGRSYLQAHHSDYNKPLLVEWLCPKCHKKHHPTNGKAIAQALRGQLWSAKRKRHHSAVLRRYFLAHPQPCPTGRPWLRLGISRRTWYRRQAKQNL